MASGAAERSVSNLGALQEAMARPVLFFGGKGGVGKTTLAAARAVESAQAGDTPLLFEAGTGVGKSLAYLVPAIIRAIEAGRPCIVSTHTISLQEQIQNNDHCRPFHSAADPHHG